MQTASLFDRRYSTGSTIDIPTLYFLISGMLLISMVLLESVLHRLPFSAAMVYLPIGWLLGSSGLGVIHIDLTRDAALLTEITRIALLVSLFTVGLKLRVKFSHKLWRLPLRLGLLSMLITIPLLTLCGVYILHLSLPVALVISAILAPTDPVLASDVQIQDVGDQDNMRFSLSGEGGLNDGTAYPFIMLALALLGIPGMASYTGWTGAGIALWGALAGPAVGWVVGWALSQLVIWCRQRWHIALGMEEFLAIGIIALSYSLAELIHGTGFLAVFAAGLAMRGIEAASTGEKSSDEVVNELKTDDGAAVHPRNAPAYLTETVLSFNRQLEHFAEFFMVLLLGILLSEFHFSLSGFILAGLLFLLVRPISVWLGLLGADTTPAQRRLIGWFGIRGIGSLYYLCFVLQHWHTGEARRTVPIVLTVLALSVVAHGISAMPLMNMYSKYWRRRGRRG